MRYKAIGLFACMLSTGAVVVSAQQEFFVAPTGADANPGTKAQPFKTFQQAKEAVAKALPLMKGDITVTFRGGTYPVTKTIIFGPQDSATGTHRVIYRAAPGEKPVFSGGVTVGGWTSYKDGIWKVPLNRNDKLRALYVNDTRAIMANSGRKIRAQGGWGTYTVTAGQATWAWQSGTTADGVKYNSTDIPVITQNPSDVEIENQTTWNKNFIGVRDITTEGDKRVFKLQQPYGAIAQQIGWGAGLTLDSEHIIHNAFELLDQPGEFYFDRAEQTLYYIPHPGEDMMTATVIVPVTATLLRIEGQPLKKRVRNISFEGLTFAHTDYNLMDIDGSHGKATVQTATIYTAFANSNWHYDVYRAYDVLPGVIIANAVEGLEFVRNTITHTGCEGLVLCNDIQDTKVVGNVICDAGGGAITLGHPHHTYENDTPALKYPEGAGIEHEKFPAGSEAIPRRVLISNNFLPDNAALFNGHTIITVFYANEVTIEHNWIPNAPYSGMNVGWGWCDFDSSDVANHPQWGKGARPAVFPGKPTTVAGNNRIHANRVERTMSLLHDGGGIYTLGGQPGTLIDRNYVRSSSWSIYNDEGSAFIINRANVIQSPYGLAHYAGDYGRKHDLAIEGYFATEDKWDFSSPGTKGSNNTICPNAVWPVEAQKIIIESGLEPEWSYLADAWMKAKAKRDEAVQALQLTTAIKEGRYEAEFAELSGGSKINTDHRDYSGTGFVDGYHNNGIANTTFTVKVPTSGSYQLTVRYCAGMGDCTNVGLAVNGQKIKTVNCKGTANWDTWGDHAEVIHLKAGLNTISLKSESSSGNPLNIDYIKLMRAEPVTLTPALSQRARVGAAMCYSSVCYPPCGG